MDNKVILSVIASFCQLPHWTEEFSLSEWISFVRSFAVTHFWVPLHEKTGLQSQIAVARNVHIKVNPCSFRYLKSRLSNSSQIKSVWGDAVLFFCCCMLFCLVPPLLEREFLKSDQYAWFSRALSHIDLVNKSPLCVNRCTGIITSAGQRITCK